MFFLVGVFGRIELFFRVRLSVELSLTFFKSFSIEVIFDRDVGSSTVKFNIFILKDIVRVIFEIKNVK